MKFLKWFLVVVAVLALLFFFIFRPYMRKQTKTHSPEITNVYQKNDFDLSVTYSSPKKKGRVIFGELVPYDVVWRTGANEPTKFSTSTTIRIADKSLAPGRYSLWTKPGKESWNVIFNKGIPDWGVTVLSGGKETSRNPEEDVVEVTVPTEILNDNIENFTIDFEDNGELFMSFSWDKTKVKVPINK